MNVSQADEAMFRCLACVVLAAGAPAQATSVGPIGQTEWHVLTVDGVAPSPLIGAGSRTRFAPEGEDADRTFGWTLAADADFDGDGTVDLIVGNRLRDSVRTYQREAHGGVAVRSGATCVELASWSDDAGIWERGSSVFASAVRGVPARVGRPAGVLVGRWKEPDPEGNQLCGAQLFHRDADRSQRAFRPDVKHWTGVGRAIGIVCDAGKPLVVLGAPRFDADSEACGALLYFDLDSGELVRRVPAQTGEADFGSTLAVADAWPGHPGGVVATSTFDEQSREFSLALFDALGETLARRAFATKLGGSSFEPRVACLGDLDGDGTPDWALGLPGGRPSGAMGSGVVLVTSSRTQRARCVRGDAPNLLIGAELVGVGDWNGDGTNDLAVTAMAATNEAVGRVHVIDGKTLAELERFVAPSEGPDFGRALAAWSAPATESEGRVPRLAIGEAGRVWIVDARR